MKIGLIGNMNNNHFALLRYFRDLGHDAELLLYSTDGVGDLSHFSVESDTWFAAQWQKYVTRSAIPNLEISALAWPAGMLMSALSKVKSLLKGTPHHQHPVSTAYIKKLFKQYDLIVGTGICPALCERAGRHMDIFIPYSTGVEFLGAADATASRRNWHPVKALLSHLAGRKQRQGVVNAYGVWNGDVGYTSKVLKDLDAAEITGFIPMVYNCETFPEDVERDYVRAVAEELDAYDFSVFAHTRLKWTNKRGYTREEWRLENKRNDFLVRAFAEFLQETPDARPCLVILEYGPDVAETKKLCEELGIEDNVIWLPKTDRKHIVWLLARIDVVAGEFYDVDTTIWGGVGWEALAYGKPLIHGFNFQDGEFEKMYGMAPPKVFGASSTDEIKGHLKLLYHDPALRRETAADYISWFDEHAGVGAAKRMLDVLHRNGGSEGAR